MFIFWLCINCSKVFNVGDGIPFCPDCNLESNNEWKNEGKDDFVRRLALRDRLIKDGYSTYYAYAMTGLGKPYDWNKKVD